VLNVALAVNRPRLLGILTQQIVEVCCTHDVDVELAIEEWRHALSLSPVVKDVVIDDTIDAVVQGIWEDRVDPKAFEAELQRQRDEQEALAEDRKAIDVQEVDRLIELKRGKASLLEYGRELKAVAKARGVRMDILKAQIARREAEDRPPEQPKEPTPEELRAIMDKLAEASGGLVDEKSILPIFGKRVEASGLVGETVNAMLLYLALISRMFDKVVSVVVKGVSSGGKSFTVQSVLTFFPVGGYMVQTTMSDKSMFYDEEDFKHKHLIIYEAPGMDSEMVSYLVRTLLSEGCIVHKTTERDENQNWVGRTIRKDGPTGLITTTTQAALHAENETRLLSLQIKDTPEQTKAVNIASARKVSGEKIAVVDYAPWHALQQWLELGERRVVIPYAVALSHLIEPVAVRLRRDVPTLQSLIQAHALLHRKTRSVDAEGRIMATLDDYAVVRELVATPLDVGTGRVVDSTVRETVNAVAEVLKEKEAKAGLFPPDAAPTASYLEIGTKLKLDKSAAGRRVRRALSDGYLHNLETRPRREARIVLGAAMPEDMGLLPTAEQIEHTHASLSPENPCLSASRTNNPTDSDHLLRQMPLPHGDRTVPHGSAEASLGSGEADCGKVDCRSNSLTDYGETVREALRQAIPGERHACVSVLVWSVERGRGRLRWRPRFGATEMSTHNLKVVPTRVAYHARRSTGGPLEPTPAHGRWDRALFDAGYEPVRTAGEVVS
jgi:hypothetical protein